MMFKKYKALYFIAIPGIVYFIILRYIPLFGSVIAFENFNIFKGPLGSPWVGLKYFNMLFQNPDVFRILKNTLIIGLYELVVFPVPLILALLLNEIRINVFKRSVQTIVYMPHFLNWVIISGMFISFLSPTTGVVNDVIKWLGHSPIYFMGSDQFIRPIIILSGVWQSAGWGTIIYLAALTGINPELYEAANVDGANRWRQMVSITIPAILPTFAILLVMHMGKFLDFGFERVIVWLNPLNQQNGDILDTYIYQVGLQQSQYSFASAIGLLKSVVGLVLMYIANFVSKKATGNGLF